MNERLYLAALNAANDAYAPYSDFKVGAAVLLDNDMIITGNNQENASFSLTMCAERVALFYAQSQFPMATVRAIAVASCSTSGTVTPCGACRQVMMEVATRQGSDFDVVMNGKVVKVSELLPLAFKL